VRNEFDLFTIAEERNDEPVSRAFTFETEEKKAEIPASQIPPKPLEDFNFVINEPIQEPVYQKPEPQEIVKEEPVKPTVIPAEPQIEENDVFESESDFTFINKTITNEKVQERRNKLKEFNSRYQNMEVENEFETVPAFRRKNISIGQENASEQKINNFLADNNGKMQVRENRFLNKDVD
jgi:cell division protein FtsZ